MATTSFAKKVTTFAPLTREADSFSAHTYAKPDFRLGRLAVADFQFPTSQRLEGFQPSYSSSVKPGEVKGGEPDGS